MSTSAGQNHPGGKGAPLFPTTHWSVVLQAGESTSDESGEALEQLCRAYWYPLYVYVRRRSYSAEDAADLTQEFFAYFLSKEYFRLADPKRGRFRTFLLHALEHFLVNQWKRARRLKRGGGQPFLSLDAQEAETRFALEPSGPMTPERAYEKRWAMTLLEGAVAEVKAEYAAAGKAGLFRELGDFLWGTDGEMSYAELARHLATTEVALRTSVHRLRERFRQHLRAAVTQTVADPAETDEELRHLLSVIAQAG